MSSAPRHLSRKRQYVSTVLENPSLTNTFKQVHEEFDDDEDTTEEERQKSNAFEVWLEGPEVVVYHARGECNVDLTEEQIGKILDDLETRVRDESILQIPCTKAPQFLIPGLTPLELQSRSYYPL